MHETRADSDNEAICHRGFVVVSLHTFQRQSCMYIDFRESTLYIDCPVMP